MLHNAEYSIPHVGLSIVQAARLAQTIHDHLGPQWSIQPWLGRLECRVLVTSHGVQAERARVCASNAFVRLITLSDEGDTDYHRVGSQIRSALEISKRVPNPFEHLNRQSGFLPELARALLDARARSRRIAWEHPEAGRIVAHPRQGWIASDERSSAVVNLLPSEDWVELPTRLPESIRSYEHWIFHAVLRWRDAVPEFPDDLRLHLHAVPDIAAIAGQPRLLHALLALEEQKPLGEVASATGCPRRLIDALVMALSISGLIADFHVQTATVTSAAAPAPQRHEPVQFPGLRRIAHFLGISRAIGW